MANINQNQIKSKISNFITAIADPNNTDIKDTTLNLMDYIVTADVVEFLKNNHHYIEIFKIMILHWTSTDYEDPELTTKFKLADETLNMGIF